MKKEWKGFIEGSWCNEVNVSDFIKRNYVPYDGADTFLAGKTVAFIRIFFPAFTDFFGT